MLDPLSFILFVSRRFRRFGSFPAEIMQALYEAYQALMIELLKARYFQRLTQEDWLNRNLDKYLEGGNKRRFGPGF